MTTILVCGSRKYTDADKILEVLAGFLDDEPEIIHGAAKGADSIAGEEAENLGYKVHEFPADWNRLGKRAGFVRNLEMLDQKPDCVIAFGSGRGTDHTVMEAKKRGIPVIRFT